MPPVLDIDSLLESPLADLHALAGELDIEGYRLLRKPELTIAILEARGAIADEIRPKVEAKAAELAAVKAERERRRVEREEAEEAAREAAREQAARERRERASRGRAAERRAAQHGGGRQARTRGDRSVRGAGEGRAEREIAQRRRGAESAGAEAKSGTTADSTPTVTITGTFEPGSGGGGRLRTDLSRRVRADADVPRGEVRRWRLHRGDVVTGEAKPVKRGRTDFQLVRVASVNGRDASDLEGRRVRFAEAEAVAPGKRFAARLFKHAPVKAGARVVVTGPTRALASEMLAKLAGRLADEGLHATLVLTVTRPEAGPPPRAGFDVVANAPGAPAADVLPGLELALDRAKRMAEAGRDAVVLVDGLDLLPESKATEVFACARNLAQHGSLTVVGSAGAGSALEAQSSTIAVVAGGRRLKLDKKASWSSL